MSELRSRLWVGGSPDSAGLTAASFGFHSLTEITEGSGEKVVLDEAAAWPPHAAARLSPRCHKRSTNTQWCRKALLCRARQAVGALNV